MRVWVGFVTLAGGLALWLAARRERAVVPPSTPRLAVAVMSLGLATLASTRAGFWWSISAISFSLVAIILLLWVIVETVRR